MSKNITDAKINSLVENLDKIQHGNLKKAATQMAEEKEKREVEGLKRAIVRIDQITMSAVRELKAVRKSEATAKELLTKVAAAQEQFEQDANIQAYADTVFGNDNYRKERFLAEFQALLAQ